MRFKNNLGYTPLHMAAKAGHLRVTRELLMAGARADLKDQVSLGCCYAACLYFLLSSLHHAHACPAEDTAPESYRGSASRTGVHTVSRSRGLPSLLWTDSLSCLNCRTGARRRRTSSPTLAAAINASLRKNTHSSTELLQRGKTSMGLVPRVGTTRR